MATRADVRTGYPPDFLSPLNIQMLRIAFASVMVMALLGVTVAFSPAGMLGLKSSVAFRVGVSSVAKRSFLSSCKAQASSDKLTGAKFEETVNETLFRIDVLIYG
jgi:hypothetical protein